MVMVNTVGSYENKHWQKKWIHLKQNIHFTPTQQSLIVGSLLGDATMRVGKGAANANFKIEQGLEQKEYVYWKYEILKPLVLSKPQLGYRYDRQRNKYAKSWWFRTFRHPQLTDIYLQFYTTEGYRCGIKIVPKFITKFIDPLALAIWVMDDGSYSKGKIDISTYAFSLEDIKYLQKIMLEKFQVGSHVYKDRDKGYRMCCSTSETKKLIEVIRPHIISSMMYKIGFHNPVTT